MARGRLPQVGRGLELGEVLCSPDDSDDGHTSADGDLLRGVTVQDELLRARLERNRQDQYIGTLINAWLARGGSAIGVHAGKSYVDVGTLHGYRAAISLLSRVTHQPEHAVA